MKKRIGIITLIIIVIATVVLLGIFEIRSIPSTFLHNKWSNIRSIWQILQVIIPLLLLLTLLLLLLLNRWALRVEKLSIGGFNILFDDPAKLYKRQISKFLETKRTIFKIDFEYDNFYETLDSHYEIYIFIREEMKLLGNVSHRNFHSSRNKLSKELYSVTNEAIHVLNRFLTKNQNDFRRWYRYLEKFDEKNFACSPIGEIQKNYPRYKEICEGFTEVNEFFNSKFASVFEVDIMKWE